MIKTSVSNLAWPNMDVSKVAARLRQIGIEGVELAPTVIWPQAPRVAPEDVRKYAHLWHSHDLLISGIQSLLYGHPELQVFDRSTWVALRAHMIAMFQLAHDLETHVAVLGSPRNRVRGAVREVEAHQICAEFLSSLEPALKDCGVVLTLEPNAPEYGADYITRYADAVALSDLISSPWIRPQVDSGCLAMVNDNPAQAVQWRRPHHVHISAPNLAPPPGEVDHPALRDALLASRYQGWVVLEMLATSADPLEQALHSAEWLVGAYGTKT